MAERRGACECLPLPLLSLLIASCGKAEEARRGGHEINCAHSPMSRDYCTFMASGNCHQKTCGQFGPQKVCARAEV